MGLISRVSSRTYRTKMALSFYLIVLAALATFICLIATVVFLVWYVGYFENLDVKVLEKPSDLPETLKIYGKKHRGCYTKSGEHFTAVLQDYPTCSTIGVYLDDTTRVSKVDELRYIVGVLIERDGVHELLKGYEEIKLENFGKCVMCTAGYSDSISITILLQRIYTKISGYLADRMLLSKLGCFIEVYPRNEAAIRVIGDLDENVSVSELAEKF